MVEPDLIDEVPTTLPLSSLALLRPFLPTTTPGWMPMETSDRWVPLPPDSMKLITALQVLCMILSEPDATACMPGETPIDTGSISTPLAAKKPFLAATTPGHTVAGGKTWPKDTLVADHAGAAPSATACSASPAAATILIPRCIRMVSLARPNLASPGFIPPPAIVRRRPIGAVRCALVEGESM